MRTLELALQHWQRIWSTVYITIRDMGTAYSKEEVAACGSIGSGFSCGCAILHRYGRRGKQKERDEEGLAIVEDLKKRRTAHSFCICDHSKWIFGCRRRTSYQISPMLSLTHYSEMELQPFEELF